MSDEAVQATVTVLEKGQEIAVSAFEGAQEELQALFNEIDQRLVTALGSTAMPARTSLTRRWRTTQKHFPRWIDEVAAPFEREIRAVRGMLVRDDPPLTSLLRYVPAAKVTTSATPSDKAFARQLWKPNCAWHAAVNAMLLAAPWVRQSVRHDVARGLVVVSVGEDVYTLYDTLPVDRRTGRLAWGRTTDGSPLVPFLQKAWTVHAGGYPNLRPVDPAVVMRWLSGKPTRWSTIADLTSDELRELATDRSVPAVFGTPKEHEGDLHAYLRLHDLQNKYGVHDDHSYTVFRLDRQGRFVLRNPWGYDHPAPMPEEVVRELYSLAFWGRPPDPAVIVPSGAQFSDGSTG